METIKRKLRKISEKDAYKKTKENRNIQKKNTLLIINLKKKKTSNKGAKMQDLMTYVAIKHIYKKKMKILI